MSRAAAAGLAEGLDVVQRHGIASDLLIARVRRLDAGEMDQAVQQHGRMAAGQHEAVAIDPARVYRIVTQHALPQRVGGRRRVHRRAGMAGLRLLHRIHRQHADGVDRKLIDIRLMCHDLTSCVHDGTATAWKATGDTGVASLVEYFTPTFWLGPDRGCHLTVPFFYMGTKIYPTA